jgi:methionyl-tRNA formyltransferase
VVAAYGQILRQRTLDLPRLGCLNIHGSLLPRWRGAAPISWSIAAGDATTGVALMQMERGLDTGPVFAQRPLMIGDTETAGELHDRLATLGADLLADLLPAILAGSATAELQPARGATYARMLTRADRTIPFAQRAASVADWINGMTPWPGAAATVEGELVLLCRARPVDGTHALEPGQVVAADARSGLFLAAGEGTVLEVLELQRAGKRVMPAKVVLNGWCPATGRRFEPVA